MQQIRTEYDELASIIEGTQARLRRRKRLRRLGGWAVRLTAVGIVAMMVL